jgi:hypothetical protein
MILLALPMLVFCSYAEDKLEALDVVYSYSVDHADEFREYYNQKAKYKIPAPSSSRFEIKMFDSRSDLLAAYLKVNPSAVMLYEHVREGLVAFCWHSEKKICMYRVSSEDLVHEMGHMLWPDDVLTGNPDPRRGEIVADAFLNYIRKRAKHDK